MLRDSLLTTQAHNHVTVYRQPDCILPKSFFEGRFIPNFHPDSLDYEQWWDEQIRRCKEGWSDGGFVVTPPYYYHLNFKKINMLDEDKRPVIDHPFFAFEDQELFNEVKDARLDGKGLMLITGRGFGKSFGASTIGEHELIFYPASEVIVSASTSLYADNLWSKLKLGLQELPEELMPSFLAFDDDFMETGRKGTGKDKGRVFGYRSKAWKVIYGKDPGKTRGTRPNIHVFEEIGSWTASAKLKQCYRMTEASWWRGSEFTCFPLLIGTGGEMHTGGSEDAQSMFWNPDAWNLKVYYWVDPKRKTRNKCAKFIPAYKKLEGFYERTGESREEEAKAFLDDRRTRKETDRDNYLQEKMEFPFDPNEAFMVTGGSYFDVPALERRYSELERTPEDKQVVQQCDLKFIKTDSGRIVGVRRVDDSNGPFEIAEDPVWEDDKWDQGKVPNLYISGCDSFDAVEEDVTDDKSKGSCKVFKRFWKASMTGNMFVASVTQRTRNGTEFYWNTVKLNMYYNARMLYEHTKTGIGHHYIINKLHHMLYPRPRLERVDVVKKPTSTNTYGIVMPIQIKRHIIKRYAEYLDNYLDNVYFASQLLDAIRFNFESNAHDETMAAAIAILTDDDMYDVEIRDAAKLDRHFPVFKRVGGKMVFK